MVITLTGDTWTQGVGQQDESGEGASSQLLRGFTSLQNEIHGWNSIVRPGIPQANVERTNDFTVTISVDQFAAYDISAPETIEVVVPPIAVSSAQVVQAPSFVVIPIKGTASLSGPLVEEPTEDVLCCGRGLELTITLTGDSWAAGVGTDPAASEALERGLRSLQDEPGGFNAVLMPALVQRNATAITRISDTRIEIRLPPVVHYHVRNPETLIVSVPASAVASKQRLVAAPARGVVIGAFASTVTLGGDLVPSADESILRSVGGNILHVTVDGDVFVPRVTLPGAISSALLNGVRSTSLAADEPRGFNAIVRPALRSHHVAWRAQNASTVAIALPQFYLYGLATPETIEVIIPAVAVESGRRATRPATFVVHATRPTLRISGSVLDHATDESVRASEPMVLTLTLNSDDDDAADAFMPVVGVSAEVTRTLLDGLTSVVAPSTSLVLPSPPPPLALPPAPPPLNLSSTPPPAAVRVVHPALEESDWRVFAPSLADYQIERVSPSAIRVRIPPLPLYRPQTPETLSLAVPAGAMRSGRTTYTESVVVISSGGTSGRVGGALLDTPHEGVLQSSGSNLTITLAGDTWRMPLDSPSILAGLATEPTDAHAGAASGWNAQFGAAAAAGGVNVSLIDEHTIMVLIPPLRELLLAQPASVVVRVPAAATAQAHRDVVCNPRLVLRPRTSRLSGSLVAHGVDEASVHAADHELRIAVAADAFSDHVGGNTDATHALLDGLGSRLRDGLTWHHVTRASDVEVVINLYAAVHTAYDLLAPETVALVLPARALRSNVSMAARAFVIGATPGAATWYPTFASPQQARASVGEGEVQQSAYVYNTRVDLAAGSDSWVPEVGLGENAATRALLDGFTSAQSEATGWNRVVRAQLTHLDVTRVNDHRLHVRISGFSAFDISAPETIRLSVPGAAVVSGRPSAASGPDVVLVPSRGSAALSGTLLTEPFERTVQSVEGGQLRFTLQDDGFVYNLGQAISTSDACTGTLIDQLTLGGGQVQQPLGWDTVVQATLREKLDTVIVRESRESLLIQLPQLLVYTLSEAETITAAIPGACFLSGKSISAQHISGAPFRVLPAVGRAYLSGSLLTQAFETEVQASSSQLTINLYDDILLSGVEAQIPMIISGSLGAAPGSWNQIVQPALSAANVAIFTRENGFDVVIDIPAQPAYAISEPETVQVVVPASMLASEQAITASPAFVIEVAGATGTLIEGSLVGGVSEDALASGELQNLTITLEGDTWLNNAASPSLLAGLVSASSEPGGWMSSTRPSLTLAHMHVLANTTLALYFRGNPDYQITAPETIAVEVPAAACASGQVPGNIVQTFSIAALPGLIRLDGAFFNASEEAGLTSPALTQLEITLEENSWATRVGNDKWATRDVLYALHSQQDEPYGWNRVVRAARQERYLQRRSDSLLVLTLPQYGAYEITAPETLAMSLPAHLISAGANLTTPGLLVIRPRPGRAIIAGGTLPDFASESSLRAASTTIAVELLGDTWRPDLAQNTTGNASGTAATARLLASFLGDAGRDGGWNREVLPWLASSGTVTRESDTRIVVRVPSAAGFNISAPETIHLVVPAEAVVSRVAPRMDLPALVLRPERGHALLETPYLSNERLVHAGSGIDEHGLSRLVTDGLGDVSRPASFTSLNISLVDDEWSPSLMDFRDEVFEVCVYEQKPNRTLPRLANISICAPSPNATNTSNGTCAYASNGTNASVFSTWYWGYPYAQEAWVQGNSDDDDDATGGSDDGEAHEHHAPLYLPKQLMRFLPIGGVGWSRSRSFGIVAPEPLFAYTRPEIPPGFEEEYAAGAFGLPTVTRTTRRLSELSEASSASNATNGTNTTLDPCTTYVRRVYSPATEMLLRGIVSAQLETRGWMRIVQPSLNGDMLRKVSNTTLSLTLPPQHAYDIDSPERLSVKLPREALRSGRPLTVNTSALIVATGGRVRVVGTFVERPEEGALTSPSVYELVFRLDEDKWDARIGHDGAPASDALISEGVFSEQSEAGGWNAVVQPQLRARHLTRLDDTTLVLTLPPFADYDISQPETLQFIIPPAAVASRQTVRTNGTGLVVMPTVGFVTLNGTLLRHLSEGYLIAPPPLALDLTLHGDTWVPNVTASNSTLFRTLVEGFAAVTPRVVQLGAVTTYGNASLGENVTRVQEYLYTGWDDVVQPVLIATLVNEHVLRFTIPPVSEYDIVEDEVLQITLAPELVRSRNPPTVRPRLIVQPAGARAYGSLLSSGEAATEYAVRNHSTPLRLPLAEPPTLVLRLRADRFTDAVGVAGSTATTRLLDSIVPYQNETSGFNQIVRPALDHTNVLRQSDDTVIIVLPRTPGYDLTRPETIGVTVPAEAVDGGRDLLVPYNFTIMPTPGQIALSGPPVEASSERYVRHHALLPCSALPIFLTALGATWQVHAGGSAQPHHHRDAL